MNKEEFLKSIYTPEKAEQTHELARTLCLEMVDRISPLIGDGKVSVAVGNTHMFMLVNTMYAMTLAVILDDKKDLVLARDLLEAGKSHVLDFLSTEGFK